MHRSYTIAGFDLFMRNTLTAAYTAVPVTFPE
jgi:hypothetical protein